MKHFALTTLVILVLVGCAGTVSLKPDTSTTPLVKIDEVERPAVTPTVMPVTIPNPAGGLKPLTTTSLGIYPVHPLRTPQDIWDRIRRGFAMPDLDSELVRDRELWYSSRPDYVDRMTERGRKYLFYIVEDLERRNMPSELVLLPFIESAFNPQAISSAKAAGIWQFMPATGRNFDLKQNMFKDDRRDVLASTRAALDYLQKLYDMFGDWHLALAAYNWGEGRVQRAVNNARKAGLSTAYADLPMPMETRFYVPKLQAVKNIIANPEDFRITLPDIQNHPFFQTVEIDRDMDVSVAASLAEISLSDFRSLNPSNTKPVLLAAGKAQILLPWDNAELFQGNLEAFRGNRLASWTAWTAPITLNVADAARRVGMTEDELRRMNQIPPRMKIKAGSTLLVHRSSEFNRDVTERVADNGYLAFAPETVLRKTLVKAGKKDTVTRLALRYRVSTAQVADWNNASASAAFKRGQKVVLYLPAQAERAARIDVTKKRGAVKKIVAEKTIRLKKQRRLAYQGPRG